MPYSCPPTGVLNSTLHLNNLNPCKPINASDSWFTGHDPCKWWQVNFPGLPDLSRAFKNLHCAKGITAGINSAYFNYGALINCPTLGINYKGAFYRHDGFNNVEVIYQTPYSSNSATNYCCNIYPGSTCSTPYTSPYYAVNNWGYPFYNNYTVSYLQTLVLNAWAALQDGVWTSSIVVDLYYNTNSTYNDTNKSLSAFPSIFLYYNSGGGTYYNSYNHIIEPSSITITGKTILKGSNVPHSVTTGAGAAPYMSKFTLTVYDDGTFTLT